MATFQSFYIPWPCQLQFNNNLITCRSSSQCSSVHKIDTKVQKSNTVRPTSHTLQCRVPAQLAKYNTHFTNVRGSSIISPIVLFLVLNYPLFFEQALLFRYKKKKRWPIMTCLEWWIFTPTYSCWDKFKHIPSSIYLFAT